MRTEKKPAAIDLDEHFRRYAAGRGSYWTWVLGPDSPLWKWTPGGLRALRVRVHPARVTGHPPSPYSTSLCAEFRNLDGAARDAIFHLAAMQQCTIRDSRDLLLSGCHFLYNWEEYLKSVSGGCGNQVLPALKDGFTVRDQEVAGQALWELFRAGTCAVLPVPDVVFPCGERWRFECPYLLGILNVTPDSFSDGGCFLDPDVAVAHALGMVLDGADALDLGAESSRPGSRGVSAREQKRRLVPVLKRLRREPALRHVPIGIDTRSAEVFRACLEEGADLLNDISALRHDRKMARLVARAGCPAILMHMQGTPRTMQRHANYADVVDEVAGFLRTQGEVALASGIRPTQILLDPGIGFGKTTAHNCELLRRLAEFRALGRPLVLGVSRKRFLGELTGEEVPVRRMHASVAAGLMGLQNGAAVLRVHDVAAHAQVLPLAGALM